jgi:subtilisin family serine protease
MCADLAELPAHSLREAEIPSVQGLAWPAPLTREWAWGGSDGSDVHVCLVDSGVDAAHSWIGGVTEAVVVRAQEDGEPDITEDTAADSSGHGTACASVIRSLAPGCKLTSVRVLGEDGTGKAADLLAGLRWAITQRFDLINMSLSTTRRQFVEVLHELADEAYFRRTMIVASAHNMPVESYPWRFSSVLSVASHSSDDRFEFHYNPAPPVEFFARGADVEVAWPGGGKIRATGNSFATPHITGLCALIAGKHPGLTPFELKSVLRATATNVIDHGNG